MAAPSVRSCSTRATSPSVIFGADTTKTSVPEKNKQTKSQFNTFLPSPSDVYSNAVITELRAVLFYFTCGE